MGIGGLCKANVYSILNIKYKCNKDAMLTVEARESTPTRTIEVDWDLAAVFMGLMMIMGALMFYEGIKWGP